MSASLIHPQAIVEEGASIGRGTRVWAFAHIVAGAVIGEECNICDHTFIEGAVRTGNRVTIKCGVYLWDGVVVEDDVFIGPAAVFTNDPRPRSRQYLQEYPRTVLKQGCSIGANATVLPGLTIGKWAMIAAGSVVTHSVPDYALVVGIPARFVSWVCRCGLKLDDAMSSRLECSCGQRYRVNDGNIFCEQAA